MIAIVDYGRGNLGSVEKAFARVGMPAVVTQDPKVVDDAEAVVLPGDGAFHDAMGSLQALGLIAPLRTCFESDRPFFGICLGYQLLFSESEEFGQGKGLDVIPGAVRRFPAGLKVPHMGWNQVEHRGDLRALRRHPERGALLLRALLLSGDRRHLAPGGDLHLRAHVPGGRLARDPLRHPVPPREEPALGHPDAGELRGHRRATRGRG